MQTLNDSAPRRPRAARRRQDPSPPPPTGPPAPNPWPDPGSGVRRRTRGSGVRRRTRGSGVRRARAAAACAGAAEPPSRGARRRLGAARTRRGFGAEHAPSSRGTQALSLSRIQAWHRALAPRSRRRCACPGPGAGAHRRRGRGGAAGAATRGSGVRRRGGTAEPFPRCPSHCSLCQAAPGRSGRLPACCDPRRWESKC